MKRRKSEEFERIAALKLQKEQEEWIVQEQHMKSAASLHTFGCCDHEPEYEYHQEISPKRKKRINNMGTPRTPRSSGKKY